MTDRFGYNLEKGADKNLAGNLKVKQELKRFLQDFKTYYRNIKINFRKWSRYRKFEYSTSNL